MKKSLNKKIKLLSLLVISALMILVGKETVFASDSAPTSFTAKTYAMSPKPLGLTNNISVKKTTGGVYVYCYDVNKLLPNNTVYTRKTSVDDLAIRYIIDSGLDDKTDNDFFATQAALWIYMLDNGMMKDTEYKYIAKIKTQINSSTYGNTAVAKDIKNLLNNAYALKKTGETKRYIEIATNRISFGLRSNEYVSSFIQVKTNIADKNWKVELVNAPYGSYVEKSSDGFKVYVPASSVKEGTTVNFSANVTGATVNRTTYRYSASNSAYQDMLLASREVVNLSDSVNLTISKPRELNPTEIYVSKKDITNEKELPGATLIVRNSKGTEIDRWVSTNEPHYVKNLAVGTYTLEEIYAPDGYVLSNEKITFYVYKDGKTSTVTMYNKPEEVKENIIVITKKDITNDKELPGATLTVKDAKGNVIDKWVSGNESHIIKGLAAGTYTLEEISAPKGYVLNKEVITFEVKDNGEVTEVVMYNTPESTEIIVPSTGLDSSSIAYILGGLIIAIGSVLIYRNAKKQN